MFLPEMTWADVEAFDRDAIILIPTGSIEQHGHHLPLFTDSLLATAIAEAVERNLSARVIRTPTLWLGASGHHLAMPGTLSASFETYMGQIESVITSLIPHGFYRFFILNAHGGNMSPNDLVLRALKQRHPSLTFATKSYSEFAASVTAEVLEGPTKIIRHACEAETSLMLFLHPELVRKDKIRDDGLHPEPPVSSVIFHFDEMSEKGSLGYATLAKAEKGKRIFDAAVSGITTELSRIYDGVVLLGDS